VPSPLTPDQARALALLEQGHPTAEVAQRLGLPRPTIWRWQQELPQFAGTLGEQEAAPPAARRPALTRHEKLRVVVTVLIVLLALLFLYLGYWA
jgi:transposase-like protein